jgi:hypothetical protein
MLAVPAVNCVCKPDEDYVHNACYRLFLQCFLQHSLQCLLATVFTIPVVVCVYRTCCQLFLQCLLRTSFTMPAVNCVYRSYSRYMQTIPSAGKVGNAAADFLLPCTIVDCSYSAYCQLH